MIADAIVSSSPSSDNSPTLTGATLKGVQRSITPKEVLEVLKNRVLPSTRELPSSLLKVRRIAIVLQSAGRYKATTRTTT
jgi:hypothetical protein